MRSLAHSGAGIRDDLAELGWTVTEHACLRLARRYRHVEQVCVVTPHKKVSAVSRISLWRMQF